MLSKKQFLVINAFSFITLTISNYFFSSQIDASVRLILFIAISILFIFEMAYFLKNKSGNIAK